MGYPANKTMADWTLNAQIIDVSTASIAYIAPGASGRLERLYCCLSAAITGANSTLTIKKGSTTIGTLVLAYATSAVGSIYEATFTGSEADRNFDVTDAIIVDGDGASSTTSIGRLTAVMRGL